MEAASQLFIPDNVVVGYQKRNDTYSAKLGFVVYRDKKGVLRKEKAWEGWRDKKIKSDDFKNEPTEGFVLNRDVGGARRSYGWDVRIEKVRVYDPRGFEFEIDIPNLLFILKECDCSRGKGLEGKFVYAWRGQALILLPASCEEYKKSTQFTELQGQSVKSKDLIPGASYITKKQEVLTFVGRFDYFFLNDPHSYRHSKADVSGVCKKYVFHDGKEFVLHNALGSFAALHSDTISDDLASLQKKYYKSEHGSKIVKLFLKDIADPKPPKKPKNQWTRTDDWYYEEYDWYYEESPGVFVECSTQFTNGYDYDHTTGQRIQKPVEIDYITKQFRWTIKDGVLTKEAFVKKPHEIAESDWYYYQSAMAAPLQREAEFKQKYANSRYGDYRNRYNFCDYTPPTISRLYAELESGAKVRIEHNTFRKDNGK